jgi:hypothetical protein
VTSLKPIFIMRIVEVQNSELLRNGQSSHKTAIAVYIAPYIRPPAATEPPSHILRGHSP